MERRSQLLVVMIAALATVVGPGVLPAAAEVVRVEVRSTEDLLGGQPFGETGAYEKVVGTIYFAVDPDLPVNQVITDIALAPRNQEGKVEFHADFYLLKPKEMARANGTVFFEVANRGRKGMLGRFNRARGSLDPTTAAEMGDGFLMREGFTLVWVGWQFDVPRREGLVRLHAPIASQGERPITGLVRSEVVVPTRVEEALLADRGHVAYQVADPAHPDNVMTVRDRVDGPRRVVPRDRWQFARVVEGKVVPDRTYVYLEGGFEPHELYDIVYRAQDPAVVGLGPAAVRDTMAWLKHGDPAAWSIPRGAIRHAVAYGSSQSGRFLRTFLYYGFNEDESGRRALDGVMSHIAGGGRGSFNHRFAQPSRDGHPFLNKLFPTDIFPFSDVTQHDPVTDMQDGLLAGVRPALLPKTFYTNSSYEYWGRAASLIHTTLDGTADLPLMDNVRIYAFAGGQHGPGRFPPVYTSGQQLANPNDYTWSLRRLLLAMHEWIDDGVTPPPSRYPTIAEGDLVPPRQLAFPSLPGVKPPAEPHKAYRVVYGPEFRTKGIVTVEPPEVISAFPILVPQVDADGNETAGLMMPEVAVPLATYTGWNLFAPDAGPPDVLSSMQGSYIPFPRTQAERMQRGDPRLSIEERYRGRDVYLSQVTAKAEQLVDEGYLLASDVAPIVARAGEHWDYLMGGN